MIPTEAELLEAFEWHEVHWNGILGEMLEKARLEAEWQRTLFTPSGLENLFPGLRLKRKVENPKNSL